MHFKMHPAIKLLLSFCIFISGNFVYSQYEKDTVYLKLQKECNIQDLILKWKKTEGIQFNLCGSAVFLFSNEGHADTLSLDKLDLYTISSIKEVEQKIKEFRYKTYKKSPPNKNDKAYQFYTRNDIFETFLIEILNEKEFVVYPVKWRNQNVID